MTAPAASSARLKVRGREKWVAHGLSNVAIAERLSLSRRTVEQHLRAVYDKLGVDNRTAATRLAVERGLA